MCDPEEEEEEKVNMCAVSSAQVSPAVVDSLLTVKGAGHGGRVGSKHLGGVGFGAFFSLLSVNTL